MVHMFVDGTRIKTVRSNLSVTDLAKLVADGAQPAGPPPLPSGADSDGVVEVERVVSRAGTVTLGGTVILAAEILAGRQVGIRIEGKNPAVFDLASRELLRTRPNPIPPGKTSHLRGVRPVGPPPRPSAESITVQRRVSSTGIVMVCGQKIALGRTHGQQTVTIHVADTTLAVELDDGETRVIRRTTTVPVRNIKASRPRTATSVFLDLMSHISWRRRVAHHLADHKETALELLVWESGGLRDRPQPVPRWARTAWVSSTLIIAAYELGTVRLCVGSRTVCQPSRRRSTD